MLEDLTQPERRMRDLIKAGDHAGFGDPPAAKPEDAESWGPERRVRAEVLIALLTEHGVRPWALQLTGARITGSLDLSALVLASPLVLEACFLDEAVVFDEARAPRIELTGSWVPSVSAREFESRGDLRLDGLRCRQLLLEGARIGGALSLRDAELKNGHEVVLDGNRLDVRVEMDCSALHATGEVRLSGAHIGGVLSFEGASLCNDGGYALTADGLRVDQDMLCRTPRTSATPIDFDMRSTRRVRSRPALAALEASQTPRAKPVRTVQRFVCTGELSLVGAHVGGQLNFGGASLKSVIVNSKRRPALTADGLQVDRDMLCRAVERNRFQADGELRLAGARIGGHLDFGGAEVTAEDKTRPALFADGLRVAQDMLCQAVDVERAGVTQFEANGEVRLLRARIAGVLSFDGAALRNEGRVALNADGLEVDGEMRCRQVGGKPFHATGDLRLLSAQIGGASFAGATVDGAFRAQGLRIERNMFCTGGFTARGRVDLRGLQIRGLLSFDDGTLESTELALGLERARVDGDLRLRFRNVPAGSVSLSRTNVGGLFDREATWPRALELRDCVYSSVHAEEDQPARPQITTAAAAREGKARQLTWLVRARAPMDVQRRLSWIRRAEASEGYSPQPYTQLLAVYKHEGRDGDARLVAYERERRRRSRLGRTGRVWNVFLQWTVGYGYWPFLALLWFCVLVGAGALVFSSLHSDRKLVPAKSDTSHPQFVATIYTVDRLIPVVSLGLRDQFVARGAAEWLASLYTVLGWVITIAVVAGVTAVVRRE